MAFQGLNVEIRNLDKIQLRFGATDKQIRNAVRNAQDQQARNSKVDIDRKISSGVQLPATQVRRRTYVKKVNPGKRDYAAVAFSGKFIPLKYWDYAFVPVKNDPTGTRAFVVVRNTYSGKWDRPYAFINPKGQKMAPLVRYSNIRNDIKVHSGLSLRRPFDETITAQYLNKTSRDFEKLVADKVASQVRRVR